MAVAQVMLAEDVTLIDDATKRTLSPSSRRQVDAFIRWCNVPPGELKYDGETAFGANGLFRRCGNRLVGGTFCIETIILPRQARDKHRENSPQKE